MNDFKIKDEIKLKNRILVTLLDAYLIRYTIKELAQEVKIENDVAIELLQRIHTDGFITHENLNGYPKIAITVKGAVFIKNGGYSKSAWSFPSLDTWNKIVAIISGLGLLVLGSYDIFIRPRTVQKLENTNQIQSKKIEKLYRQIDSLSHLLKNQKTDSTNK